MRIRATATTRYVGDDFARACEVSKISKLPIWEHKDHRGYFSVGSEPVLKLDSRTENWIQYSVKSVLDFLGGRK